MNILYEYILKAIVLHYITRKRVREKFDIYFCFVFIDFVLYRTYIYRKLITLILRNLYSHIIIDVRYDTYFANIL